MTIPDYQTVMLPLLRFLGDGRERSFGEAVEAIASNFFPAEPALSSETELAGPELT